MTIETILVKRGARYQGEIGFFPDNEIASEDVQPIAMGAELRVILSSERNTQLLKYAWALATIIARNTDFYLDKDDAMNGPEGLKMKAKFWRLVVDPKTGEVEARPRSLSRLSNEAMQRLVNRFTYFVTAHIIPGIKDASLREEVARMIGPKSTNEKEPTK